MARTAEQNERIRQATRDKIQKAAAELFAQKGLAGTNVQEIADLAGISIGLLYRHYRTKEELFSEMVEFALQGLEAITSMFESDGSPVELINQLVDEVHEDLNNNEEFINVMIFMTQALLTDPAIGGVSRLIEQDEAMINAAAKLIERGQKEGTIRTGDHHKMATLLFSSIQGLGMFKGVMGHATSIPTPQMMTAFLYEGEGS